MAELRRANIPPGHYLCGISSWHPAWLQKYATTKWFMAVYCLLGTIQAMSFMYFAVTLTTIEKRFKMPSQTTGIVLSGNEISQILLSLILSYMGGQRNRPRWIAWGIVFCGLSCFILALPHFIFGAGNDILQLTKEYQDSLNINTLNQSFTSVNVSSLKNPVVHLCGFSKPAENCDSLSSIVPLVLIFCSQFVLGVGNTMYYSLGQTYMDDNTKKKNTPLMLAVAMSLRMIGPVFGFLIGFISLNTFIDPTKTPLIDNKDPRWMGAWWLGWILLGTLMCLFSGLIGLFPKQLPKKTDESKHSSHLPQVLRHEELKNEEGLPLNSRISSNAALDTVGTTELPKLKDFPRALMRLLKNKLLIYNNISGVFYVLGASGFFTFMTKYMEVQFHKSAQNATAVVGPMSILGVVIGIMTSGLVLTKKKPSISKVLMWNVIVGFIFIMGQFSYIFMYCPDSVSMAHVSNFNLTTNCNANCSCEGVNYSPVCHVASDTTYFSACHAGCTNWNASTKLYDNCACLTPELKTLPKFDTSERLIQRPMTLGVLPTLSTTMDLSGAKRLLQGQVTTEAYMDLDYSTVSTFGDDYATDPPEGVLSRSKRAIEELVLRPGVCMEGCDRIFWIFSITAMIVSWFGSSGRIGNVLVNYRCVAPEDKSFAQGLSIWMISLFALIPGPIIFGRIMDSTCLVWTKTCTGTGNCQLYDQAKYRYSVNLVCCLLSLIGAFFDFLVWYYGRDMDLYGDKETKLLEQTNRRDKAITPLLAKKVQNADS